MTSRITTHLRRNAVAYAALFISLASGTAYAAGQIGTNDIKPDAVRSKHIKDAAVRGEDIAVEAIDGDGIRDGAIRDADIGLGALTGRAIEDGSINSFEIATGGILGDDVEDKTLTNADVLQDSLTGNEIDESTLDGVARFCEGSAIAAAGTVLGGPNVPAEFSSSAVTGTSSCGVSPKVRRVGVGVYRVCIPSQDNAMDVLIPSPLHDGAGSSGEDNVATSDIVSDSGCPSQVGGQPLAYEVRIMDIGSTPALQDGQFQFIAVNF